MFCKRTIIINSLKHMIGYFQDQLSKRIILRFGYEYKDLIYFKWIHVFANSIVFTMPLFFDTDDVLSLSSFISNKKRIE